MSAEERSGWRDKDISLRHRDWGFNCPVADIDFPAIEYDQERPVAIVDYKLHLANVYDTPNSRTSGKLYTSGGAQLPFFIVRYWGSPACADEDCRYCHGSMRNCWSFAVHPKNEAALKRLTGNVAMTEQAYVAFLYRLRDREPSPSTIRVLNSVLPPAPYTMQRRWEAA